MRYILFTLLTSKNRTSTQMHNAPGGVVRFSHMIGPFSGAWPSCGSTRLYSAASTHVYVCKSTSCSACSQWQSIGAFPCSNVTRGESANVVKVNSVEWDIILRKHSICKGNSILSNEIITLVSF